MNTATLSTWSLAAVAGAGSLIAALIIWLLFKHHLSSYLSEKGKNLATREDIAEITRQVEQIKHEYSSLVEELKARQQLRMAAVDRRLQAHQEAFAHWRKLITGAEQSGPAVIDCQTWWEQNCLYLEPPVREAFVSAYMNAHLRAEFVRVHAESRLIQEAWQKVLEFPDVLFEAVKLPTLSELESRATKSESLPDAKTGA